MADELISTGTSDIPVHVSVPPGDGPWSGVVVGHDALGMTTDLRNQADWPAGEGYPAVAPDLYDRDGRVRCMFRTGGPPGGAAFDDLHATHRVGVAK